MNSRFFRTALSGSVVALALASGGAQAAKFHVLYAFLGNGIDGLDPQGNLFRDAAGDIYGATAYGGASDKGAVFKVLPDGTEVILHDFADTPDGGLPRSGVLPDKAGNFYLTTSLGGRTGAGAVVKLAPDGTESVLYSFLGGNDGNQPVSNLIQDRQGNLYGTTLIGGDLDCLSVGCGTVFRLAPDGTETVLHAFSGADGYYPYAPVVMDKAGNLYGTAANGGALGFGVLFKLAPDGTETTLHSFAGGSDGANPTAGPVLDKAGNLYGTTSSGGGSDNCSGGCGAVFKLASDGAETVLHSFGGSDGRYPDANLTFGRDGNLYGTTAYGGRKDMGTVFKITPVGAFTRLHSFSGKDGQIPITPLLMDKKGHLFGASYFGGDGYPDNFGEGVVFEIKP
ncbi:MAG TPA: choice-of-anchor tandem repeat GloVer-containing protein [Rhizomicrobium sp.]|jgi:uncharacterized repeat protein (TIGR03803 family)|nr:choice-of-anchor tandem repeat GloVer-containing protein [Rhizomicrobium sp.]